MTARKFAFIKAGWHSVIVDQALRGFTEVIPAEQVAVISVPGAFEMPLVAKKLAESGWYSCISAAALVVDGGIYRHEFVAQAVVSGLMEVGLKTGVPILSVSLTPHHYQENDYFRGILCEHFMVKGREAAAAALEVVRLHDSLNSRPAYEACP